MLGLDGLKICLSDITDVNDQLVNKLSKFSIAGGKEEKQSTKVSDGDRGLVAGNSEVKRKDVRLTDQWSLMPYIVLGRVYHACPIW